MRLAQAERDAALIQYEKTIQTAFTEVSNALIAHQRVRESRLKQEALVATLQDRMRLAYLRYRGGVDTELNALDADRDLFQAQIALAEIRLNEMLSVVQLYKALGGGWSDHGSDDGTGAHDFEIAQELRCGQSRRAHRYTERSARFAQRRRAGGSGGRAYASMHAELGGVSFHLGGLFRDRWVICGIRGIVLGGGVPHRETHARIGNPRSLGCPSPAQAARLVVTEGLPLTASGWAWASGSAGSPEVHARTCYLE